MQPVPKTLTITGAALALSMLAGQALAKDVTLGFVAASMQYTFNVAVAKGFQDAAKELGAKAVVLDPKGSVEKQGNAIEDLITQKVDGIGTILIDSVVGTTWVDRASDGGIAFVATATPVGDPNKVPVRQVYPKLSALVIDDDVNAGELAGEYAATLLPKGRTAKIAIAEGAPGNAVVKQRIQGFQQGLAKAGANYKIVASQPTDWTFEKGEAVCQNILTANPDTDLFFAHYDDIALGCVRAITTAGSKAKVVTTHGGSRRGIVAVKNGEISGAICAKPETLGRLTAKALYDSITGSEKAKARFITYKQIVVTKDNVQDCPPEF